MSGMPPHFQNHLVNDDATNPMQAYPTAYPLWYAGFPSQQAMANLPPLPPQLLPLSASPPAPSSVQTSKPHQRTYQACYPCRERKVKCDLGHPDSPVAPCSRCRRENKQCVFADTRRKTQSKKRSTTETSDAALEPLRERSDSVKRLKTEPQIPTIHSTPHSPGGPIVRTKPLRRPSSKGRVEEPDDEEDQAINDDTAEFLQKSEIHDAADAMATLASVAATRGRVSSHSSGVRPNIGGDFGSGFAPGGVTASPIFRTTGLRDHQHVSANSPYSEASSSTSHGKADALRAWSRLRFVRAGLFTASEGIAYIQYFYQYMNPLTPVTVPLYQDPATHARLLIDEPVLAVTILTIASRYMKLSGPGADTRAFTIHEKLWIYLKAQIQRVYLGQEQFGGGFCGAGQRNDVKPQGQTTLRSLGTVESLLLLTEWHARALHFPPGADSEELLDEDFRTATFQQDTANGVGELSATSNVAQQIDHWLEPAWRSDRMIWSLLGSAIAIAAELGVFMQSSEGGATNATPYNRRRENVKRLLYISVTQTSGRLSLPSLLPPEFSRDLFANGQPRLEQEQARTSFAHPAGPYPPHNHIQEVTLYFWHGIAKLFEEGNSKIFASKELTRRIISDGSYVPLLQDFDSLAQEWQKEFKACKVIPSHMRHNLSIEYEYAIVYANSIGLTAVVERCTSNTASKNGVIPPAALLKSLEGDRKYLQNIIKASQNFLRAVVDGLLPHDYLKHSPARTYIRIIAVSMMLLKTFALGATGDDVDACIRLLRRTTTALRTCVVDDVHISTYVAELIETLTQRASARLVRIRTNKISLGLGQSSTDQDKTPNSDATLSRSSNLNGSGVPNVTSPTVPNNGEYQTNRQQYVPNAFGDNVTSPLLSSTMNPNFSIMPPATFNASEGFYGSMPYEHFETGDLFSPSLSNNNPNMPSMSHANYASNANTNGHITGDGDFGSASNDWVALPLDALFNSTLGNDVTQTGYGPDVGGRDMLNLLLMDDPVDFGHTG